MKKTTYRQCSIARSALVKIILEQIEELGVKYDMDEIDYNKVRASVRHQSFRLENTWLRYVADNIDNKMKDKINVAGEEK